jgi:hypothetical protein
MDANSIQMQALITFLMPLVIQLAKKSQARWLGWIDQSRPKMCMLASGVAALLTSMGIGFARTPHSLTVTWPDATTLLRGLLSFLVPAVLQFAAQHALYDGFWKQVVPTRSGDRAIG